MTTGKAAPSRFKAERVYGAPEAAGRRLLKHARDAAKPETAPDRIFVERVNGPFLFKDGGTPAEYSAGMAWLISEGCIDLHESGCYFVMHPKGHDLFEAA